MLGSAALRLVVFEHVALEDARGELEIEAAFPEIPAALGLVPLEQTPFTIRYLRTTLNG